MAKGKKTKRKFEIKKAAAQNVWLSVHGFGLDSDSNTGAADCSGRGMVSDRPDAMLGKVIGKCNTDNTKG